MLQFVPDLDRYILAAFNAAYSAGRTDVAEHLLCALECLCEEASEEDALSDAYRIICSDCRCRNAGSWPPHRDLKV